jgi:undecaprenyl-diphosphatase
MMSWNTELLLFLNAPAHPTEVLLAVAKLLSDGPVVVVPLVLACLWIWGRPEARPAHLAVAACLIAGQSIKVSLGVTYYELTPFMAGQDHTLLNQASDNNFPRDHAALCWSCGLGLILTHGAIRWGAALCMLGMLTCWGQVYLGVHYPVDMLASLPIGLLAGAGARVALPLAASLVAPTVEHFYERILTHLRSALSLPRRTRV